RVRLGTGRRQVADVDGRGAEAELAPGEEIEAEVHALDKGVLRDDEPVDDRCVVLDAAGEASPFELREQPELPGLVEPHSSSMRARPSSVAGSSAYSASWSRAWNVPGPPAPAAASSAAAPNAASAPAA